MNIITKFKEKYDNLNSDIIKAFIWSFASALTGFLFCMLWTNSFKEGTPFKYVCSAFFGSICAVIIFIVKSNMDKRLSPKTHFYSIMAFVLCFLGFGLAYAGIKVGPFGDTTVLLVDMYHQYAPFFIDFKDRIFGGEGLLYANGVGMGANYIPQFSYYLASPFNIIALIFPKEQMTMAIALIEVLKAAFAALTFSFFLRGTFKKNNWSIVMLSLMYALSAFTLSYMWNIMWFDCLVFMPLAALGLYRLIYERKYTLYCIALGLTLLSNFYLGFMVCITMVIYFFTITLSQKTSIRDLCSKTGRFALGSVIGGCFSAVLTVPTYLALQLTSSANDILPTTWNNNFEMIRLIGQQLYGNPTHIGLDNAFPNIYCGVIVMLLIPLYLMNKRISNRQKIVDMGFLGIMFFSLTLNLPDWIWHGGHYPNSLPYRFAFVYVFAVLIIAARTIFNLKGNTTRHVWISAGAAGALILLCENSSLFDEPFKFIYTSIFFIVIYCITLLFITSRKAKRAIPTALLSLFVIFEILSNCVSSINYINENHSYAKYDGFYSNYTNLRNAVDIVKGDDPDSLYRTGQLPSSTCNDSSTYSYRGMTSFSSSTPQSIIKLLGRLGYANNGVNSCIYSGFTPVSDSILGMKYLITSSYLGEHPQLQYISQVDGTDNTQYIYENRYALPMGFAAQPYILNWQWEQDDPFLVMNDFIRSACGVEDVFEIIPVYAKDSDNAVVDILDSDTVNISITDTALSGSATFGAAVPYTGQVYAYSRMSYMNSISISSPAQTIWISENEPHIGDVGTVAADEEIDVNIELKYSAQGCVAIAVLNTERFEEAMRLLGSQAFEPEIRKSSYIKGTFSTQQEQYLLTSIPYDKGWTVKIDGKKAQTEAIGGALLAVRVSPGNHSIEFSFWPSGLTVGILLTLFSIASIILINFYPKIRKRYFKSKTENPELLTDQEENV